MTSSCSADVDRPTGRARVVVGLIGLVVGAMFVLAGALTVATLIVDGPAPSTPRPVCVTHDADGSVAHVGSGCEELEGRQ